MRLIAVAASILTLAACSPTAIQIGAVHQLQPNVVGVQIVPQKVPGCEVVFRAYRGGQPVIGCLYRPGVVGALQTRWL